MKRVAVLSGAGVSAESGIKTFRDAGGLWEGHDVMEVASPEGFEKNPELVMEFYNLRRKQLFEVEPNAAHIAIAKLEKDFHVNVITQNVDDLHERAGSTDVLHLHGELLKVRSVYGYESIEWTKDLHIGDLYTDGSQLRPDIVWFGEPVPAIEDAMDIVAKADYIIVVGTSMQVYPAAGLVDFAADNVPVYYIDPNPAKLHNLRNPLKVLTMKASEGMPIVVERLRNQT
jgi:NAD-dependent deacetylase